MSSAAITVTDIGSLPNGSLSLIEITPIVAGRTLTPKVRHYLRFMR